MLEKLNRIFVAAALALLGGADAIAQCPIPDQLDGGPCCTRTRRRLPRFSDFTQESVGICWKDCDVEALQGCEAKWSAPLSAPDCGPYYSRLRLRDAAGVKWRGRMRLQYSRTWLESDPASGKNYQVWRFLAGGDLRPTALAGPSPCPVPPCAAFTGNRVHFTGYVDWALDCDSRGYKNSWMLTHACDLIDHHPGFPRAGTFHPDRSYSFVGPAAGFVPSPLQPVEIGASPFEAVRRVNKVKVPMVRPIYTCDYEESIDYTLTPLQQFCLCGSPNGPMQWVLSNLFLAGACGTGISTPGGPFLPGFLSMGIGMWTDPTTYPGVEHLRWNVGGYDYVDPCAGTQQPEVFYGVSTFEGYPAIQLLSTGPAGPLPPTFIDQVNSLRQGATIMNVPSLGDHVLNLNL